MVLKFYINSTVQTLLAPRNRKDVDVIKTARIEIHPKMDMDVNWGTNKLCIMGVIKNGKVLFLVEIIEAV